MTHESPEPVNRGSRFSLGPCRWPIPTRRRALDTTRTGMVPGTLQSRARLPRRWQRFGLLVWAVLVPWACKRSSDKSFQQERRDYETKLVIRGPAPTEGPDLLPIEWLEVFDYESSGYTLRGYRARPKNRSLAREGRVPGLLYLHGSFALAQADVKDTLPFLRAGFAVYAPALRGENGNPGYHELFYGELDDARAALEAMRQDPLIDQKRLFVFGHGAGGVLSALLTLSPTLDAVDTGSAGGIYQGPVFDSLELPFQDSEIERRLRLFIPHMRQMKTPHLACVDRQDPAYDATVFARVIADRARLPLTMLEVAGDHVSSLSPCLSAYLNRALALARS